VLDVLEAAEEDRVEHRRDELRDAAADAVDELALEDLRRVDEAARPVARTGDLVEVEALAGQDDVAVDEVGDAVDVRHARGAAGVAGRVRPR
jgi:hypothetical protein